VSPADPFALFHGRSLGGDNAVHFCLAGRGAPAGFDCFKNVPSPAMSKALCLCFWEQRLVWHLGCPLWLCLAPMPSCWDSSMTEVSWHLSSALHPSAGRTRATGHPGTEPAGVTDWGLQRGRCRHLDQWHCEELLQVVVLSSQHALLCF
jgi:hypothetical protein